MEAIVSCDSKHVRASVGACSSDRKAMPINLSLMEATVLAPLCLKEMSLSSVLLHSTITLMCRDGTDKQARFYKTAFFPMIARVQ